MTDTNQDPKLDRAAILLIHGVGQQNPYQILDTFTRGLVDHYGRKIRKIEPRLFTVDERGTLRSCVSLQFNERLGRTQVQQLDLYEFYWAGMVQGQVTLAQILRWCLRTSLPPLKLWSQQSTVSTDPNEPPKRWDYHLLNLLRELGTAFALLLAISLVFYPIFYIGANLEAFQQAGGSFLTLLAALTRTSLGLFGTIILVILLVLELFVLFSIGQILYRRLTYNLKLRPSIEQKMLRRWGLSSLLLFVSLLLLMALVIAFSDLQSLVRAMDKLIFPAQVGWGLVDILLALLSARFMIDYVGDIPLYVDADEKSEFYRTRSEIKRTGVALIKSLMSNEAGYSGVYIVSHSLGTVIAYDCLNQIMRDVRAGIWLDLNRLRGLITFGSPLDKIYYFFRDAVGDQQAVLAQIHSFLHGFRKKSSGRDYAPYGFAPYDLPQAPNLAWINVYSPLDIISDRLDFYQVDEQIQMRYLSPITAHTSYWRDPKFYCIVTTLLEARGSYQACLKS